MEELRKKVDEAARKAHTKRLDISLNELADMHTSGELEINPEFQRNFVWEESQQSRFVESLLLELPTPPFYVVEHEVEEGRYQLVDGLQRLSSYLHFIGHLDNPHVDPPVKVGDFLTLQDCDIIDELNDHQWDSLPSVLRFRLRRSFISVHVIQRSSDRELKYHMFNRLNAGGTQLSEQQIRNCSVRMLGSKFLDFIDECAIHPDYCTCIEPITDEDKKKEENKALVLRFFAFKNYQDKFVHDVNPFLDSYIEGVTRHLEGLHTGEVIPFNINKERAEFAKIFGILATSTGNKSFTFPNKDLSDLTSGFSRYHFEGVTTGIAKHVDKFDAHDTAQMDRLKSELIICRKSQDFAKVSRGGGKNSRGQAERRTALIEQAVLKAV